VRSALTCSKSEVKALRSDIHDMHKQHTEEFTLVIQKFPQVADDNKQLLSQLLPMRNAAAAAEKEERNDHAARAIDEAHQHRLQRARFGKDAIPVLARDEVLDLVFSFVGIGDYYYVAGVCRNWRGRYMTLCHNKAVTTAKTDTHKFHTLHSNTVMTESRLQLALDNGLTIERLRIGSSPLADSIIVRSLEPMKVLTLARLYGIAWNDVLTQRAAETRQYELLKWLLKYGCPCDLDEVLDALRNNDNDDLEHMKQLRAIAGPWPSVQVNIMMRRAGRQDELDTAKWCHEQGAVWPDSFHDADESPYGDCWSSRCVQWAIATGSTWLEW
jgi:hypothetical protein